MSADSGSYITKGIKAFTFAETLVALAVFGVLAATALPLIFGSTDDARNAAVLKKTFNDLTQAIEIAQAKNDGILHIGSASYTSEDFRDDLLTVIDYIKADDNEENIFTSTYKFYNGGDMGQFNLSSRAAAVLGNGTMITVSSFENCTNSEVKLTDGTTYYTGGNACGDLHIDINGNNGPNMFGKDLFYFLVVKEGTDYIIQPAGLSGKGDLTTCENKSDDLMTSYGCTAKMILDPDHMP